jgi:hypothetical protein
VESDVRDDFSRATIETLAKRVGHRCSNPSCRKLTSGPHTEPTKALNVGVAAHVTAASVGGPRYDPSLTPDERKSIDNASWLCQSCAKLVDNDEARYTRKLLRNWEVVAEQTTLTEIQSPVARPGEPEHSGSVHSLRFAADDWQMWRERGNRPGDGMWVISGWKAGSIRYSVTLRLRNNTDWEEQLHRLCMEFHQGENVLLLDEYAFNGEELVLPPKKWVKVEVVHGLHDRKVYEAADSVWCVAETVGDNQKHQWRVAAVNASATVLE